MPRIEFQITDVSLNFHITDAGQTSFLSMMGYCSSKNFDIYLPGGKVVGSNFPVEVIFSDDIKKSFLTLYEYTNKKSSFLARLAASKSLLEALAIREFADSEIRLLLNSGDSYLGEGRYATLRFGDDPDGDDMVWNLDRNSEPVQLIESYDLRISQRLG